MATTTNLNSLVINYLTQAQYDEAAANNTLNENQLYLTPTGITAADISRWNSKSDTDEKLKLSDAANNSLTFYPIIGTSNTTTATTKYIDTTGLKYYVKNGTTDNPGWAELILGNNISEGVINNKFGMITIYSGNSHYTQLTAGNATNDRILSLPDKDGTIALTSDIVDQIFIATYNTTSYSDVLAAYNAGKIIICKDVFSLANTYYGYLEKYENNTAFYFASPLDINSSGDKLTVVYTLNSNNTWSTDNIGMESSSTQLIRWTEV